MHTIDLETCIKRYEDNKNFKEFIYESVVCTNSPVNVGTCMGDSGGF